MPEEEGVLHEVLERLGKETDFGFNQRPLSYGDFKRICRNHDIYVIEKPLLSELKGILTWYNHNPYICINSRLQERERTYVAFCELGHFFLHDKSNHFFTRMQDKWQLAEMAMKVEAGRYLLYRCAYQRDKGERIRKQSAIAKLFCSTMAREVASISLQVHGCYGYTKEFNIERIYRDVKLNEVAGGNADIQRVIIANTLIR